MEIVNSQSGNRNLQDGSVPDHRRDPNGDGLLLFNHRLSPAITTWKEPVPSGTTAKRTRVKGRYTDRCQPALRRFIWRKNHFQVQILYPFRLGSAYAGKVPQKPFKHFIKRWMNCFETS